ncbi:MAG: aminotransferase class IV [Pseudomonadota bacterium]
MNTTALCWIDDRVVSAADAHVSVLDHGALYGDGVFEGLRFYHRRVFREAAHLHRLRESANAIGLKIDWSDDYISRAMASLISALDTDSGYLRLVVTRGKGNLGIDPQSCPTPTLFIVADELSVMNNAEVARGIRLHLAQTRRIPAVCLDPAVKSLNYLNNILARIEANRAACDEALMLNSEGRVCEGSVDNIFIVRDGVLQTPPLSDGMLAGITRAAILEAAKAIGIEARETSLMPGDIAQADECFLTGTGAELVRVREFDGATFDTANAPVTAALEREFWALVDADCAAHPNIANTSS